MNKHLLIVGMGRGLSLGVARRFGREGYTVSMISRNSEKLSALADELQQAGVRSAYAATAGQDATALRESIAQLREHAGPVSVLHYNAAAAKKQDILEENADSLAADFRVNVANVLEAVKALHDDLKTQKGAVLLTGGGFSQYPQPAYGSLSIGKAGMRSLGLQLYDRLQADGIYTGMLTIAGFIQPDSITHSPDILAENFWQMFQNRSEAERMV